MIGLFRKLSALRFAGTFLALLFTLSCAVGSDPEPKGDFDGIGQGNVTSLAAVVQGQVQFKDFDGGEIVIEARQSFPCAYGRCPVIEVLPLGSDRLKAPGAYHLALTEIDKNIVIIATYFHPSGGIRIAHTRIEDPKEFNNNIDLSLDRPHPPLR